MNFERYRTHSPNSKWDTKKASGFQAETHTQRECVYTKMWKWFSITLRVSLEFRNKSEWGKKAAKEVFKWIKSFCCCDYILFGWVVVSIFCIICTIHKCKCDINSSKTSFSFWLTTNNCSFSLPLKWFTSEKKCNAITALNLSYRDEIPKFVRARMWEREELWYSFQSSMQYLLSRFVLSKKKKQCFQFPKTSSSKRNEIQNKITFNIFISFYYSLLFRYAELLQ